MRTEKCDTATSFEKLNFELDPRTYELAVAALDEIGTSKTIQILSNNPRKSKALQKAGYKIVDRVTLSYEVNETVQTYLLSKQDKLGHLIDWQKIKSKAS